MNATQRQYLFGVIFFAVGIYYMTRNVWIESSLYAVAGLAFVVNALTLEPKLKAYKRILVILSWVLIISAGLLLLYMVQFRWF